MYPPFYPPPNTNCPRCKGIGGYLVKPRGEYAVAEVCSCVPECDRCGGSGQAVVDRDGFKHVGRCRCQMRLDRIRLFNQAGIPARHARSSFMSFDQGNVGSVPAFMTAMTWVQDFTPGEENRGLVLWGKVGRGKTHLLVSLLRDLIFRHGVQARFVEFSRLLSLLKEGYSSGVSDASILADLATIPVLAIDEMGKGRLSDWELAIIDEVVSRRYNAMGCIVASTNYLPKVPSGNPVPQLAQAEFDKQTLGDRVGWRVFSRLQQMCIFVEAKGEDYRRTAGSPGQPGQLRVVSGDD